MAVNLSSLGGVAGQFFDNNGDPLSGGKIYTYLAGTTTPALTYTSTTGNTPHTNPIVLDAAGRVPGGEIWLTDGFQYKFLLKTSADVQIGSYDNVNGINANLVNFTSAQEIQTATASQTVFTLTTMQYQPGTNSLSVFVDGINQYGPGATYAYEETSSTVVTFNTGLTVGQKVKFTTSVLNSASYGNAEQIGYTAPYTNSTATNVEAKLAQTVSVKDFGAIGDGAADDTAAIQAAIDAAYCVYVPSGTYLTSVLTLKNGTTIYGDGNTSILQLIADIPSSRGILFADSGSSTSYVSNINISNLQLLGRVATAGFSEFVYNISLHGVNNVQISNCLIKGFQGDGVHLGSGVAAGAERHNKNVSIRNCVFDGINNDNRNGISVIDGSDVTIHGNTFINCTRSNMPGCIDVEPNAYAFHVVRNIRILNNYFENCQGNIGFIGFVLSAATFTNQPKNFIVANNVFQGASPGIVFINSITTYSAPFNVAISGNSGVTGRFVSFQGFANGVSITNNSIQCNVASLFGFNATDECNNFNVVGNNFTGDGTSSGLALRSSTGFNFIGNTFNNFLNYHILVGLSGSTTSYLTINNNYFSTPLGSAVTVSNGGGTINGATCCFYSNTGEPRHTFPAWRVDNCGLVTNGITATSFNSATLPDSFPEGVSVATINGDTGVPNTGGYQGTLTNYRLITGAGLSKNTHQVYYPGNNTTDLGSFYLRKRDSATNTWTAWYKVTGV